eukprot:2153776-Amphidinium_carterae.1
MSVLLYAARVSFKCSDGQGRTQGMLSCEALFCAAAAALGCAATTTCDNSRTGTYLLSYDSVGILGIFSIV